MWKSRCTIHDNMQHGQCGHHCNVEVQCWSCTVSASISIISNQLPGQIIFSHDTSHHHYDQTNNAVVKIQSCRGDEVMKLGHNVHDWNVEVLFNGGKRFLHINVVLPRVGHFQHIQFEILAVWWMFAFECLITFTLRWKYFWDIDNIFLIFKAAIFFIHV